MIACLLIPHFAAAVECWLDPALARVPLVISQATQAAARVVAVSGEAAACGIVPGMSLTQAQSLCPQARIMPAKPGQYQATLAEIVSLLAAVTPKVEPDTGPAAALIYADLGDISGGAPLDLAGSISQAIQTQLHLTPALGLATGKFPAYMAASSIGLKRALLIAPGQESGFLAPIPVTALPLDPELARRFNLLGLRALGQLATLPAGAVLTQFGRYGQWLQRLAQGRDDRPVLPYQAQPTEQITRQLDGPVADRLILTALAQAIAGELAQRLVTRGYVSQGLTLILHLEDDTQWQKQLNLRQATNCPRRLARHLAALIESVRISQGVVALTVKLSGLSPASPKQLDLFINLTLSRQEQNFEALLPGFLARYGADCFYDTALTNPLAHLPEQRFQLRGAVGRCPVYGRLVCRSRFNTTRS
jgi:DNA polymerase-4